MCRKFKTIIKLSAMLLCCWLLYWLYSLHHLSSPVKSNQPKPYRHNNFTRIPNFEVKNDTYQKQQFPNSSHVAFPFANVTRSADEIFNSKWVKQLKTTLVTANNHITLIMVSIQYFSTLINWLAYATIHTMPLAGDLLVVCSDVESHEILLRKGVRSVVVTVDDVTTEGSQFSEVLFGGKMVVRLTVLRLLNSWGYDVMQMDSDAVILNNILPILDHFSDSDIIASTIEKPCTPMGVYEVWGFCVCMGVVWIKHGPKIEKMWQRMADMPIVKYGCDQTRMNNMLVSLNITWEPVKYGRHRFLRGTPADGSFTMITLPQDVVCRSLCYQDRLSSYYVYHPDTLHHAALKGRFLSQHNVWKVVDQWKNTINSVQPLVEWLNEVTV